MARTIFHWLTGLIGVTGPPEYEQPRPRRRQGFSDGGAHGGASGVAHGVAGSKLVEFVDVEDQESAWQGAPGDLPFASTGPQGHRARMRDRLLNRGATSLADYELLEMLLFFAFKKGDTKPLAKTLINRFGSFAGVLAASQGELSAMRGLGPHSVTALKLVQESALRLARTEVLNQPVLGNWDKLIDYLTAVLAHEPVEQFRVLFLDTRNRLIADEAQARGTVNHTPVYPREVVKRALELHATALILVHNHPSGDPKPSRDDLDMTAEISRAASALGIVLHDHIIVGKGSWISFRQQNLLT